MDTVQLVDYLDELLNVSLFKDASVNGLQVQGNPTTNVIVTAATASLDAIDAAIEIGADTLLVHHGLFWKGASPVIKGNYKERIKALLDNNINLLAYHLPLDANLNFGNNINLCKIIGANEVDYIKEGDPTSIAMLALKDTPSTVKEICASLSHSLDTRVSVIGTDDDNLELSSFGVCSGSGSFILDENNEPGFDALITGDVNEQTYHMCHETGTVAFVVGHHASEQDGVKNLGMHLSSMFALSHKHLHFTYEKNTLWYEAK